MDPFLKLFIIVLSMRERKNLRRFCVMWRGRVVLLLIQAMRLRFGWILVMSRKRFSPACVASD
ncbi:hypothetical protein HMPREF2975_01855 [Actinomyces sp. HMSC065F12]|nr:hypothetical protein HMPREF2975_01855 [Actinomyces sp. HMSC065F12]